MNETSQTSTPVLFIIFNRPETTQRVFEAIRRARPTRLYIAADGPRPGVTSDVSKCAETRRIVENVDWPCKVKRLFRAQNLNCGLGPSSAITWFFEHEEQGIILEDDCLPASSFFLFCEELLNRYANDTRIMHIGGNNFQNGWQHDPDYSYYFSRSGHIWGWATWRRAWKHFDFNINRYQYLKEHGFFDNFFLSPLEKYYRLKKFDKTIAAAGKADWWDYQWDFARFSNNGLAIVPQVNLVKNIGFGEDATHTTNLATGSVALEATEIEFPLKHPPFVIRDLKSDKRYFKNLMKDVVQSKVRSTLHIA
jgi:hypothetical protein